MKLSPQRFIQAFTGRGKLPARRRLSVGVIVDLYRGATAGGHVRYWERVAEAARGEELELTTYFLGDRERTVPLADNVRYVDLRPLFSTKSLACLKKVIEHTDLSPLNPRLLRFLRGHDVIHTTDAYFCLARTAQLFAAWARRPLVTSIHTDTPRYTRLYSGDFIRRLLGEGRLGSYLRRTVRWEDRLTGIMERRLSRHLERCDWVFGSRAAGRPEGKQGPEAARFSILHRGIDKEAFHPRKRDRRRLRRQLGIGEERLVLIFAGRLDPGKNVVTLARAARALLERGLPLQLVLAGDGNDREEIRGLLGDRVSLVGWQPQEELTWLYASSDLFASASEIEITPNTVLEAKASGLPVIVSAQKGSAQLVRQPGRDGLLVEGRDPLEWARTIEWLARDRERRLAMGGQARSHIESECPSWREVLRQDLLPVWRRVARERGMVN
jgi:glycosyltransferase involved in cell wall biosynthesis